MSTIKDYWFIRIVLVVTVIITALNYVGIEINGVRIALAIVVTFALTTDDLLEWLYVVSQTFHRDLRVTTKLLRWRLDLYLFHKTDETISNRFLKMVKEHPDKTCFIAEDRIWTYEQVNQFSNRVANVFNEAGFVRGDVVALYMDSSPEFVCIWLGLAKLGVITALVSHNLKLKSLIHSISTVNSKALIFGNNLGEAVAEVRTLLTTGIDLYCYGENGNDQFPFAKSLSSAMQRCSPSTTPKTVAKPEDHLLYFYSSGTTGLPKAAIFTNIRFYAMTAVSHQGMEIRHDDIVYAALPLCHTAAGVMGVGHALCYGVTLVIKKKFSASQFWDDCIKYNCTVAQYIGEVCRYLLVQPPKPQDTAHSIRTMFGNGLRPKLWEPFVKRFGIKKIVEFYGATEGISSLANIDNKPGAVGFLPRICSFALPGNLIRMDENTLKPLRDENGLCIPCKPGEAGVYVGKVIKGNLTQNFDGYVDREATSKKILRDVFRKGDQVYFSGDILVMDRWGYVYFKDRTGDTFRWKGENVSTTEVESVISDLTELNDCIVYGVEVPSCEGRAGMAAIVDPNQSVDLGQLYSGLVRELPSYARPLFIRLTDSLPMTGTLKLKKLEMQSEGFNPAKCGQGRLYYLNGCNYSILTEQIYNDICIGKAGY